MRLLKRDNKYNDRMQVLVWMEEKIKEILFIISEKRLFESLQNAYELCVVAKTFVDTKITFLTLKLCGCLLMHLDYAAWAVSTFTIM